MDTAILDKLAGYCLRISDSGHSHATAAAGARWESGGRRTMAQVG